MLTRWRMGANRTQMSPLMLVAALALAACGAVSADDWAEEAERLARVFHLRPDMALAEIGAGRGELTVEMARRVPQGPGVRPRLRRV